MEQGELKLRVRVLEGERAARRQQVLQEATLSTVALFGSLQLGSSLAMGGQEYPSWVAFAGALVFAVVLARKLQRVKTLDTFEQNLKR